MKAPDNVHVVGWNASSTTQAKFLVALIKDKGAPVLVPSRLTVGWTKGGELIRFKAKVDRDRSPATLGVVRCRAVPLGSVADKCVSAVAKPHADRPNLSGS
jgi:hypothetical protein